MLLCTSCHLIPLKPSTLLIDSAKLLDVLTLLMDSAKLLDVLTSLPVSHAILPHAVCFATSCQANHATCSFIDSGGFASGPIRRCLFIDYIIIYNFLFQQGIHEDLSTQQSDIYQGQKAKVNITFKGR